MLRIILALTLLFVAGGIGFFFGRHLHPVPPVERGRMKAPPDSAAGARAQTRSRVMEPGPAPSVPSAPQHPSAGSDVESLLPAPPVPDTSTLDIGAPLADLELTDLQNTFDQARDAGERRHEATDIMAPKGTPVLAVASGIVKKLFSSKPGGLTIYQFDSSEEWCFYYAHLDGYARGLREGMLVKRGDVIGYVGSTGNAGAAGPHLHFAIFKLGPEKRWWQGEPVNPYPLLVEAVRDQRARKR